MRCPVNTPTTYANPLGEALSPLLSTIRRTGFFEAPVYMTLMTLGATLMFMLIYQRVHKNGTFSSSFRTRTRSLWLAVYFSLCFFATSAVAVGWKTLIIEETDYAVIPSYIAWVGPLHFYISSVALAHLVVVWRHKRQSLDRALSAYVQVGLFGGYLIAGHRIAFEPWDFLDPTSGVSGLFMLVGFSLYHFDLLWRQSEASLHEAHHARHAMSLIVRFIALLALTAIVSSTVWWGWFVGIPLSVYASIAPELHSQRASLGT